MSTIVVSSLVDKLKGIQNREGLSSRQFAKKLGVSAELWRLTQNGQRRVGASIAQGILKTYPELKDDVLIFLRGDVDKSLEGREYSTNTPQTSQNGILEGLRHLCNAFLYRLKSLFCYPKTNTGTKNKK